MHQVHGSDVIEVAAPGSAGEGDALLTSAVALPIAVRTADCVPVVIHGETAVAVVHAGWRGMAAEVVTKALEAMRTRGAVPKRAAIGPSIGPCCFEVGDEVVVAFGGRATTTAWGTPSVDLWSEAGRQLDGLDVWRADLCTRCEKRFHSYRGGAGSLRQTSVGWL
jgi:YfiH family protein